ncbi:MAG: hypothetical protein ACRDF4_02665 [Rhabdochlamydiaceae bacterium]
MGYNQNVQKPWWHKDQPIEKNMSEYEGRNPLPISVVRYGIGKEIQLYTEEVVVKNRENGKEIRLPLETIEQLTLTPGDPHPSKLVLMADLTDGSTMLLAEGMTNARDFREMLPHLIAICPEIQLDPPDMAEQLRQALNNRRAWNLTCYGMILFICLSLYGLYMLVAFIGMHH